jgi:hypothetical protein
MNRFIQTTIRPLACALGVWLGTVVVGAANEPAKPATEPAAPVNPAFGIALPRSVFVSESSVGKDPFNPRSVRRLPVARVTDKVPVAATVVDRSNLLNLRGVSGPAARRIALINNLTFVAGEEGSVRTTAGMLKIRVLEVLEKSVRVVIEGEGVARELKVYEAVINSIQIQTSQFDKK